MHQLKVACLKISGVTGVEESNGKYNFYVKM